MAFSDFYMQTTGSNLNAGSTTNDAASLTYAGGTFVRATGVFTVGSGNPSSDGVAVGDWISIYTTAAATTTQFVGKCTARDATTITVEITTNKLGVTTAVSETAAATTAKVGGAWANEIVLSSTGIGSFNVAFDAKVNIKAGTYTVTASRTTQFAGTAVFSFWLSGYNTTPGDLDNDTTNTLAKPVWSCNSGVTLTFSSANAIISGLSIVGTVNAAFLVNFNGAQQLISRCRVENTNSGSNAPAVTVGQSNQVYQYCWFKSPTTTTSNGVVVGNAAGATFIGCVFDSGGKAGYEPGTTNSLMIECVFLNNTGSGVVASTGRVQIMNCTFSSPTVNGVAFPSLPGVGSFITGCIFSSCPTAGINNTSGTNNRYVSRSCNTFYNCGANESNWGNSPSLFGKTDSSAVLTSASDMTPVSGSNARANGFPGIFENQTYKSYVNIGAVQQTAGAEVAVVF